MPSHYILSVVVGRSCQRCADSVRWVPRGNHAHLQHLSPPSSWGPTARITLRTGFPLRSCPSDSSPGFISLECPSLGDSKLRAVGYRPLFINNSSEIFVDCFIHPLFLFFFHDVSCCKSFFSSLVFERLYMGLLFL